MDLGERGEVKMLGVEVEVKMVGTSRIDLMGDQQLHMCFSLKPLTDI